VLSVCYLTRQFCLDINKKGEAILEDRPCGAEAEHRQGSKTINAREQKRLRAEKRRGILAKKHHEAVVKSNTISKILDRNKTVENEL